MADHVASSQIDDDPEGPAYEGEVEMISTRTLVGSIGIRANHEPIMTMLDPTELRLLRERDRGQALRPGRRLPADGRELALMLVEEAIPVEELDVDDLRAKLGEAEARLEKAEAESAAYDRAKNDVARYTLYLAIAES